MARRCRLTLIQHEANTSNSPEWFSIIPSEIHLNEIWAKTKGITFLQNTFQISSANCRSVFRPSICSQSEKEWDRPAPVVKDFLFAQVVLVLTTQIARFMGPTWGPWGQHGAHVGPMSLAIRVCFAFIPHRSRILMKTSWHGNCLHIAISERITGGFPSQKVENADFDDIVAVMTNDLLNKVAIHW